MSSFLYERVKLIATEYAGSQLELAKILKINGRTFQGYLTEARQDILLPLLPKILATYTQISRNWLYFGEGDMLASDANSALHTNEIISSLQRECETLRARLADKEKIIALYEAREQEKQNSFTHPTDALGTQAVAPLSHHDSE